jgi:hypothetical protein
MFISFCKKCFNYNANELQAASCKPQASSCKPQASSCKQKQMKAESQKQIQGCRDGLRLAA